MKTWTVMVQYAKSWKNACNAKHKKAEDQGFFHRCNAHIEAKIENIE